MLATNPSQRKQTEFVTLDVLVFQDHLLRKINFAIDFSKTYEFVDKLYCEDNGCPAFIRLFLKLF